MRFSHEEYRVKESDGHVEIKVIVSGHRNFPIQVVAKSFVPTKFNLPAGQINMIKHVHNCIFYVLFYTTATGDDFKVGAYKLYFPVNYNVATVKIPIYNDYIVEGTEVFAVSLYISEHYRNKHVQYGDPFLTKVIIDDGQYNKHILSLIHIGCMSIHNNINSLTIFLLAYLLLVHYYHASAVDS